MVFEQIESLQCYMSLIYRTGILFVPLVDVYQKWNKCLFKEMHAAFKAGRLGKDPATFW